MIFLEFLSECGLALGCFFEKLGVELAKKETLLVPTAYDKHLYLETFIMSVQKSAWESLNYRFNDKLLQNIYSKAMCWGIYLKMLPQHEFYTSCPFQNIAV